MIDVDPKGQAHTLVSLPAIVKWKKKWRTFWSLNFFIFGYVKGRVLGNNNISIKSAEQLSYGSKTLDKLGSCPNDFQNLDTRETF